MQNARVNVFLIVFHGAGSGGSAQDVLVRLSALALSSIHFERLHCGGNTWHQATCGPSSVICPNSDTQASAGKPWANPVLCLPSLWLQRVVVAKSSVMGQ